MRMPNFLIIGAAKAGTTSLHYYVSQHPQVYMSPLKEPRFFALEGETLRFQNPDKSINQSSITNLDDYCNLFRDVKDELAIGEASPLYLYSSKAVERIHHYIPNVKLIAILRNPVERAYSCYKHLIALEPLSFSDALADEENRIRENWAHLWHYQNGGYYYKQLTRYFKKFSKEQISIHLFDDLKSNPNTVIEKVFTFLEIEKTFTPDYSYKNVSKNPKVKVLQNIVSGKSTTRFLAKKVFPQSFRSNVAAKIRNWNSKEFPPMNEEVRSHLLTNYKEDILNLQDLLNRDLSHWMK